MINKTNEYFSADVERLICLSVLLASAFFLYGTRVLVITMVALTVALICDLIMRAARANCFTEQDLSSYVIAITIILMFPASVSYIVVITSIVVAILVGKYAFGGLHHYPFNPAAVGFTVALVSWPDKLTQYPIPFNFLPLQVTEDIRMATSHAFVLGNGGLPSTSGLNLLIGNFAGPMGATFTLVLIASAILLCIRKRVSASILIVFTLVTSLLTLLFPRVDGVNPFEVLHFELSSGVLLFAIVFIVPDRVCTPKRLYGKILYAVVLSVVAILFRYYGAFEIGICFAVIIVSALSGFFDKVTSVRLVKRWIKKRRGVADGK